MMICELHFEPKFLRFNKRGCRLTKDAVPTIFDANPLALPIIQQSIPPNQEAIIPEISIKEENTEFIPPTRQLVNDCDRCAQQDVAIQALKAEIAKLQSTCTERLCIIQGLQKEIRELKGPERNEPEIISHLTEQQNGKSLMKPANFYLCKRFECYICKTEFGSVGVMRRHMVENHRPNAMCFVCSQQFTSLEFDRHICTGLESLSCTYCQQSFMSMKSLLEHLNGCDKSEKFAYKCDQCRSYFFMESLLSIHTKNHEVKKNDFVCDICTKSFATKQLLGAHKRRHNGQKYLCDKCGKGPFQSRNGLTQHKKRHVIEMSRCEKCGQTFSNETRLKGHVRNMHRKLKMICNICGAKMQSLSSLNEHKSK